MGTENEGVLFDERTDASFLTLAPVGSEPGLQMREPLTGKWLDVEKGFCTEGGCIIVFVGDFLEVLTKGSYRAACHRVLGPSPRHGSEPRQASRRLSMPFLVRGQPEFTIDTAQFLGKEDKEEMPLLRLEGMKYATLRHFLDLKGRRRFSGQRLLQAADEAATVMSGT